MIAGAGVEVKVMPAHTGAGVEVGAGAMIVGIGEEVGALGRGAIGAEIGV